MASWHLAQGSNSGNVGELSIYWADNRMNGTVKKACPNFPLFVPTFTSTEILEKHLKRCGRKNLLDHSLFLVVDDEKIHLFNANHRAIELYLTLWGKSTTALGDFVIEKQSNPPINYSEVFDDTHKSKVKSYFSLLADSIEKLSKTILPEIDQQLSKLDSAYKSEDKLSPKETKKKSSPSPKANKKRVIRKKAATKSKSDRLNHQVVSEKQTVLPPTTNKRQSLSSKDREIYVPNDKPVKAQAEHIGKKSPIKERSFIERHCGAPTLSTTPSVNSAIKIVKEDELFTLSMTEAKRKNLSSQICCEKLLFKTRAGAKKAIEALENKKFERTEAILYLSKRTGDDGNVNRTYFPIVKLNNALIDVMIEDWGGTPFGYSLHKCWNNKIPESNIKSLHQSEEGIEHIGNLLSSGKSLNLGHGMMPMIAM